MGLKILQMVSEKTAKLNKVYDNQEDAKKECLDLNLNILSKYNNQYDDLQM